MATTTQQQQQRGFGVAHPACSRSIATRKSCTGITTKQPRSPLRRAHSNISVLGRPSFRTKVDGNIQQQKDRSIKEPIVIHHKEPVAVDIAWFPTDPSSSPLRQADGCSTPGYSTSELADDDESDAIADEVSSKEPIEIYHKETVVDDIAWFPADADPSSKPLRQSDGCSTHGYSTDELTDDDESDSSSAEVSQERVNEFRHGRPRRRVGFHVTASGEVLCHESLIPIPLTAQDIKEFWWTRRDGKVAREEAKNRIRYIAKFRPEYKQAAQQLQSKFGNLDIPLNGRAGKTAKTTDEEAVAILAKCNARGLEKPLLPFLKIPCHTYRNSLLRLLETQARLVRECSCDPNERAKVLARQYREDAQAAVAWARLLADGDALVASGKTLYNNTQ